MNDPAFNFYSDNFLTGTMFFTDEQLGKYIRLLCAQHLTGHLSEENMLIICKKYDEKIWAKFKKDEQNLYYNERLEREIIKRREYSKSRSLNKLGKKNKRLNHKKKTSKSYDIHMGNGYGIGNEIENKINIEFEIFWNAYDKKVGDKTKLCAKWNALKDCERDAAMKYIPLYIQSQPEKKFRKNPETFLNNHSWNDEIINSPIMQGYLPI
jgi:hypothetical protein